MKTILTGITKNRSRKTALWAFSLLLSGTLSAAPKSRGFSARIDIAAKDKSNVLTALEVGSDGSLNSYNWQKDAGKNKLRALMPGTTMWQEASFKFSPLKDGKGIVSLRGPYVKLGDNKIKRLEVSYRKLTIDGKTLFQAKEGQALTVWHDAPKSFEIELKKGVPVTVSTQFKLNLDPNQFKKAAKEQFLDLRKHVNMGFQDDVAGDGKGGWSDQGAENDLKYFDLKQKKFGLIPFQTIDPAGNDGKAVMTFRSKHISPDVSLQKAEINIEPQTDKGGYRYLYIMHTTCWNPGTKKDLIGKIEVVAKNGDISGFKVRNRVDVCDWWMPVPVENGAVVYEYRKNPTADGAVGLYLSRFTISDIPQEISKVTFETAGKSVWIVVGATLSNKRIDLKQNMAPVLIKANEHWRPVDFGDFKVKKGSALDFSSLVPAGTVEQKGRVVIRGRHFEYEKKPGQKVRFVGCSMSGGALRACKTKKDIENYVRQIKLHGFSMVRPHFLDFYLMRGGKADFDFNPKHLDKFDYLVKCMRDEGLYLYFDFMTGWSGYKKGSGWDAKGKINLKGDMLSKDEARKHWQTGLIKLLTRMNPYTNTTLAQDPVMAASVFFNEQELWDPNTLESPSFKALWAVWLKNKYKSFDLLKQAWTDEKGRCLLAPDVTSFSQVPFVQYGSSLLAIDSNTFLLERMNEVDSWYVKELAELGCRVAVSNWDCFKSILFTAARTNMNSVSMHGYHAHPTNWILPQSMQSQKSSIKNEIPARYFTKMALTRFLDRPFLITEYLHSFWNTYRFEEGLLMGAGAAWQDMDCLMAHAEPVRISQNQNPIKTFCNYNDPIQRASEVVSKLLFVRQDLKAAEKSVELVLDIDKALKLGKATATINTEFDKLAFMTGVGVRVKDAAQPEGIKPFAADLSLEKMVLPAPPAETLWSELLPKLKEAGILPPQNGSRPLDGYMESSNGALTLDSKIGRFKVITERLEGMSSVTPTDNLKLKNLKVISCSEPAAVTAASLDLKPLSKSRKVLLVCATNALNSGMEFYGKNRRFLKSLGKGPILLKSVKLDVELKSNATSATAWALSFSGERREQIPINVKDGKLELSIDTSKLKSPTVFFELVANE